VSELIKKFHAFYGVQCSFLYSLPVCACYIHVHTVKAFNGSVTAEKMWSEILKLISHLENLDTDVRNTSQRWNVTSVVREAEGWICISVRKGIISYIQLSDLFRRSQICIRVSIYIRVTLYWGYLIVLWLFCLVCILYCGCFNLFCKMWCIYVWVL
jgi:hypothetical protein